MILGMGYIFIRLLFLDLLVIVYGDEVFEKKSFIFSGICRYMWFNLNWNWIIYEVNYVSFYFWCLFFLIFFFMVVSLFIYKDY